VIHHAAMKLNWNLSLARPTKQRSSPNPDPENQAHAARKAPLSAAAECSVRPNSPFDLLTTRAKPAMRIPLIAFTARPVLRGNKAYLRTLRRAEMAAWEANVKFPMF
jgi:hypothetical protein